MKILGIETSCDETAAAVVEDGTKMLSNEIASQVEIHARYGGIVPEVASRQHTLSIIPIIRAAMRKADVGWDDLSAIAVTHGPGLAGSLLTGVNAAKAIALVIPDLKGKFDGYSLRVPTPTVSVVDFTAEIEKGTTTEELRQAFRDAAKEARFKGILEAVDEPLVSMDFKGSSYSSSIDLPFTSVLGKEKNDFIKVVTWYDNEWGYSVRTADLAAMMAKSL